MNRKYSQFAINMKPTDFGANEEIDIQNRPKKVQSTVQMNSVQEMTWEDHSCEGQEDTEGKEDDTMENVAKPSPKPKKTAGKSPKKGPGKSTFNYMSSVRNFD